MTEFKQENFLGKPVNTSNPDRIDSDTDALPRPIVSSLPNILDQEEAKNHEANRKLRKEYAGKAYCLVVGCLIFWGFAIIPTGVGFAFFRRQVLSDTVLIAITTGATINVLAALLGVIRGLFPASRK